MNDKNAGNGLVYSDNIALAWKPADYEPEQTHLAMVNASNESFLRAVSAVGDGLTTKDDSDAPAGIQQDIARLDLKLNLVLDLVSALVYHELDIPPVSAVQVSAEEVTWQGEGPPMGTRIFLELYIQRGLPKPLCCYGDVVTTTEDQAAGRNRVRFVGLTGAAGVWLEKLIFRHHRREVAFRRAHTGD